MVAEPVEAPLQLTLVWEETDEVMADGWVSVAVCVFVQTFASFIVHVYVPAARPLAVTALPPDGLQV